MGEVIAMTKRGRDGDPQIEDGFLMVANELAEAMCWYNFTATESRIIWYLIRRTYGFNETWARISTKEWEEGTRLRATHIYRTIRRLVERNVVTWSGHKSYRKIRIQKHYKKWKVVTKPGHSDQFRSQASDQVRSPLLLKTKDNKERITRRCSLCRCEFQPREKWMDKCETCFEAQRSESRTAGYVGCVKCSIMGPPGQMLTDVDGVCFYCREMRRD